MHAKFPFYSIAQMYAFSQSTPVFILLGFDNMYWVVDQRQEFDFVSEGCSLLNAIN